MSHFVPISCFCTSTLARYELCSSILTHFSALDIYSASDHLPRYLSDPNVGHSYEVQTTPFQAAVGTTKPRWEWLEEEVSVESLRGGESGTGEIPGGYPGPFGDELERAVAGKSANELIDRPEHTIFGLAMLGGGRVFGEAHLYGS